MNKESFHEPNSPEERGLIETGMSKPQTNDEEGGAEFTADAKPPCGNGKRGVERAGSETDSPPVTPSYLVPADFMNRTQQRRADESFGSDFLAALDLLRERIWLIILCILVTGIAGVTYIILTPPIYRAQAVIQVEQRAQRILKANEDGIVDLKRDEIIKTTEQALTSPDLLLQLAKRNELDKDPAFLPELKRPASDNQIVEELGKQISVQVRRGTWLIDIGVTDR